MAQQTSEFMAIDEWKENIAKDLREWLFKNDSNDCFGKGLQYLEKTSVDDVLHETRSGSKNTR